MLQPFRVLVAGTALIAAIPSAAMTQSPERSRVTATGSGDVALAPDWAIVAFTVTADDSSAFAAASASTAATERVRAALAALGLSGDSLVRVTFGVQPRYNWAEGQQLLGYRGEAIVRVDVRRLGQLAGIIDTALAAGATAVWGIQFRSHREEEARVTALKQAVARARADAEVVAVAAGGRLGRALEVRTRPDRGSFPPAAYFQVQASVSGVPELSPQEVVVAAVVEIDWELVIEP
jgi:hypothetical protein